MPSHLKRSFAIVLFTLSVRHLRAEAQTTPVALDSGTLVRVTPASGLAFEGRLVQPLPTGATTLVMCRYPGPPCTDARDSAAIRRAELNQSMRLQVQRGTHAGSGALLGTGIGAVLGLLGRSFANGLCDTEACSSGGNAAPFILAGVGAAIGGLFGWASPRWGNP